MRLEEQGLKALTERGLTAVPFDAIWDCCVPRVDVMRAVLDDSSYPPLGAGGGVAGWKRSRARCSPIIADMTWRAPARPGGRPAKYLLVQPNWSSGLILVAADSIWRESFRAAKEVPLSLLPAHARRKGRHPPLALAAERERRRGHAGQREHRGRLEVGTHSCCVIAFELPPQAKAFTSLVGVDGTHGPGACASARSIPIGRRQTAVCQRVAPRRAGATPVGPLPVCRLPEAGAGYGVGGRGAPGCLSARHRRARRLADAAGHSRCRRRRSLSVAAAFRAGLEQVGP